MSIVARGMGRGDPGSLVCYGYGRSSRIIDTLVSVARIFTVGFYRVTVKLVQKS